MTDCCCRLRQDGLIVQVLAGSPCAVGRYWARGVRGRTAWAGRTDGGLLLTSTFQASTKSESELDAHQKSFLMTPEAASAQRMFEKAPWQAKLHCAGTTTFLQLRIGQLSTKVSKHLPTTKNSGEASSAF